jgi:AcrR family transcriptional regulator
VSDTAKIQGHTQPREASKELRRRKIGDAARELLREVGVEQASVREIARRAGVSPTTIFNLCGNKAGVLQWVFRRDFDDFEALVAAAPSADSLGRLFDAIVITEQLFSADPGFYKATLAFTSEAATGSVFADMKDPRLAYWKALLRQIEVDGFIQCGDHFSAISNLAVQIIAGSTLDWVFGTISAPQWRRETSLGFAITLSPFATARSRERFETYVRFYLMELGSSRERE